MNEKEALELLKKHSSSDVAFEKVLNHSKKVQEIALRFAENIPECDVEFVRIASLLHDIGRFSCSKTILHGICGADILRKEGLDEKFALVCERHLGAGISKKDIEQQGIDLPKKDYVPRSVEEKVITCADNLVFDDKEGTVEDVYQKFLIEVNKEAAEKTKKLYEEVCSMMK